MLLRGFIHSQSSAWYKRSSSPLLAIVFSPSPNGSMKPSIALRLFPWLLLFLLLLVSSSRFFSRSNVSGRDDAPTWKAPFSPADLIPLLPRKAAWPLLRSLRSAVDLLPLFVGAASDDKGALEWKGACFYNNTAWMEFHNKSGSRFGGGTLHIKVYAEEIPFDNRFLSLGFS